MKKVSRREFAKGVALAPVGLAAASSLLAHAQATPRSGRTKTGSGARNPPHTALLGR